ncbi:MAG: response regulator [Candidatus Hodarchaeales archaeon]|jgi:DNA-binding response OmpR family regulator/DNA-binding HxlR family transcriptional regulator
MNILVVDDDRYFLNKMKTLLELDRHSVITIDSSTEALRKIERINFDLILTDLKMPDLSGIEFIEKARMIGNESIIIVITGYGTIESAVEAIKVGAYDYLLKPFEFSILRKKIKDIEYNLKLRKKILVPQILEESKKLDFKISETELDSPSLVISDINPQRIIKELNLSEANLIWLESNEVKSGTSQSKLDFLKLKIDDFTKTTSRGNIIFKGIETLFQNKNSEDMKQFFVYLYAITISSHIKVLILVDAKERSLGVINNNTMLSSLIPPVFDKLIDMISHPLRRQTILLLKSLQGLSFNEISKKLSIESTSVLAFHLKKLVKEGFLTKEGKFATPRYYLSFQGIYLAEIIHILEELGEQGPFSPIKIIKTKNWLKNLH